MSNLLQTCCVCINKTEELTNILETDTNQIQWSTKLNQCVPEVDWNYDCYICPKCIGHLEIAYTFYNLCLQSFDLRKQALLEVKIEEPLFESKEIPNFMNEDEISTINEVKNDSILVQIKNEHLENNEEEISDVGVKPSSDNPEEGNNLDTEELTTNELEDENNFSKRCEYCYKYFNRKNYYDAHVRTYHTLENNRPYNCSTCGKTFVTASGLYRHTQIHLNKRQHKCNICEKGFNTTSVLRSHQMCVHVDSKDWKYVCTYCGKRFPQKSGLTPHIRRHTGEKNYACHICTKRFVDKDSLLAHVRSHLDIKLFKCNICDKEYKAKRTLNLHLRREHRVGAVKLPQFGKSKHECRLCAKGFVTATKLEKHVRSHTGEKPFKCNICEKKFTDGWYLKVHLKNKHSNDSISDSNDSKNVLEGNNC